MKLPEMTLRLVSMRTIRTQKDKDLTFVKIADEKTFDSLELILGRDTDVSKLITQTRYQAVIDIEGKYTSVDLYPIASK